MILLTSLSPRRKELLQQIGFHAVSLERRGRQAEMSLGKRDFIQTDSPVDPNYHKNKEILTLDEARKMAVEQARLKVQRKIESRTLTIFNLQPEKTVVVGADTIIFLEGRVLDRPSAVNPDLLAPEVLIQAQKEAKRMLTDLKGQTFFVITSLAIACGDDLQQERTCSVVTEVKMKEFSDDDIESYVATGEPLDKAGAFGIQERGVVFVEKIKGSYTNVVGLPLVEFIELLKDSIFEGRVEIPLIHQWTLPEPSASPNVPELQTLAVGDISYDIRFSKLPADFFPTLSPPGKHLQGEIERTVGGSAVIFAQRAINAGFKRCAVLGTIGGDELGRLIEGELAQSNIQRLLPADYEHHTSVNLILRDQADNDTALTITDARQALSENDISKARTDIEKAHVVFISGYSLVDVERRQACLKIMEWAKEASQVVVVDATVNIEETFDFAQFTEMTHNKVDVLVVEIPTMLAWLKSSKHSEDDWHFIFEQVVPVLRQHFPVVFLRTSTYSHELIITPTQVSLPLELDYSQRAADQRLGYADERTAQHLYQFMSPRLLLASSSPRRAALLRQIVANTKFEALASTHAETYHADETAEDRVKRLALEKARMVLSRQEDVKPSIEIVIGADTEIVLDGVALGQPRDEEAARDILSKLSGRTHEAITGIALIDTKTGRAVVDNVSTLVVFKELSSQEIDQYIQSGEPMGKAGAYGIQGLGILFVENLVGSYSNVMGLPLERLSEILQQDFQMPVWNIDKVSCWHLAASEREGDSTRLAAHPERSS